MKTGPAIADILKKEGVEYLFAYPVNHLIEACAAVDIRPIIVRQERIGLHMADAMSRLTKGRKMGVFCMQSGPGSENAYGGVAQAFGESVPLLVIPQGYPRRIAHVPPNFNSTLGHGACRQARRADHQRPRNRQHHAPGVQHAAQRPRRAGDHRVAGRRLRRGRARSAGLRARRRHQVRPRCRPGGRGRQGADGRQAPRDLCRPGRALGRSLCRAEGAGRASGHPGLHQPRGQELLRRDPSAGAGLGRPRLPQGGAPVPRPVRRDPGHRLLVHRDQLRHLHAEGQDDHPCHARPGAHQQGCAGEVRPGRRRQADAGRADRRMPRPPGRRSAMPPPSRPRSRRWPTSG